MPALGIGGLIEKSQGIEARLRCLRHFSEVAAVPALIRVPELTYLQILHQKNAQVTKSTDLGCKQKCDQKSKRKGWPGNSPQSGEMNIGLAALPSQMTLTAQQMLSIHKVRVELFDAFRADTVGEYCIRVP